ncbi:unnamed protein product [Arctogadus glacialis]
MRRVFGGQGEAGAGQPPTFCFWFWADRGAADAVLWCEVWFECLDVFFLSRRQTSPRPGVALGNAEASGGQRSAPAERSAGVESFSVRGVRPTRRGTFQTRVSQRRRAEGGLGGSPAAHGGPPAAVRLAVNLCHGVTTHGLYACSVSQLTCTHLSQLTCTHQSQLTCTHLSRLTCAHLSQLTCAHLS